MWQTEDGNGEPRFALRWEETTVTPLKEILVQEVARLSDEDAQEILELVRTKKKGLSAGIRKEWHSTRLSWFSEKRRIRCWLRPYASLSIGHSACSYSRGRG
jgi:hypothetical protein